MRQRISFPYLGGQTAAVNRGFTIVELLVVIVVIAILASISIVAYTSIQGRANDAAVMQDLRSIGQQMTMFQTFEGHWPVTPAEIASLDLKVTKGSYGYPFATSSSDWNLLYCRASDGSGDMALVAGTKGDKVFKYSNGSVSEHTGRWAEETVFYPVCRDAGVDVGTTTGFRDWFYINNWRHGL